jgi:pyruvate,water dikinase
LCVFSCAASAEGYRLYEKKIIWSKPSKILLFSLDTKRVFESFCYWRKARNLIVSATIPSKFGTEINTAYQSLSEQCSINNLDVAVAAALESYQPPVLPGRMESFLISTENLAVTQASEMLRFLVADRAIKYRYEHEF